MDSATRIVFCDVHPYTVWITKSGEQYGFTINYFQSEQAPITKLPFTENFGEVLRGIVVLFSLLPLRILSVDEIDRVIGTLRKKHKVFCKRVFHQGALVQKAA